MRVLVPDRWRHYGKARAAEIDPRLARQIIVGKVRWPWLPGAQWYLHYYPQLFQLLKTFQPDIIDLWEEPWGLVSAQTCFLRKRACPSAKIISETEQNISKDLPPPFENFRRYVHRHSSFLVGRSREAVEVSRQKGYRGPAEVVPNGVDTSLFRPMDRATCRASTLGEGWENKFVAGYVGRLVPEKGLSDMVEALKFCNETVHMVFVGSGPMKDELTTLAETLGVADRVRILPARTLAELPAVMNAFDVLVLASRTTARWKEQYGRVLIEAHSCKTPVAGSNSGAIPDVVDRGGVIFRERDPRDLAAALNRLQANPDECRRLGEGGFAQVHERSTWARVAERMNSIYSHVLQPTV